MSQFAETQTENNDYWINRCYDLEQKYNNLLKEMADMLAAVLLKEMAVKSWVKKDIY